MLIKEGSIVLMSHGEYSDYEMLALVRLNKDIDTNEVSKEYLLEYPDEKKPYCFQRYQFVKWFVTDRKYGDELEYDEWLLGSYNTLRYK